ncbi:translation initiation factor IF-2-like isoform X1 [Acinonyx jubatus]|uniref:Translation initiation factor IF-2-like isoform X1 n=1 Tax=Acinonyx jubatus TaxID=32536 RepID=A0ABM3PHW4_ACIJB|nr:translation initiation factor IF-2-like isoform X1 [Acinonyx jubatus]
MGGVRSDHVGQRRAVSPAAATSRASSASASAQPAAPTRSSRPVSRPARRRRARPPSGLPRPAGRGAGGGPAGEGTRGAGRGDREGPSRPPAAALRRRGWAVPRSRPLRGGRLGATQRGRPPATGGRTSRGDLGLGSADAAKAPRKPISLPRRWSELAGGFLLTFPVSPFKRDEEEGYQGLGPEHPR